MRIFLLSVLVSRENHKLQFASNSCPERARQRHGTLWSWTGMARMKVSRQFVFNMVKMDHIVLGLILISSKKNLLRNGQFTLILDLIWTWQEGITSHGLITYRWESLQHQYPKDSVHKKYNQNKYHKDKLVTSRWWWCFYCPVLSTIGIGREMQSLRRFYFCRRFIVLLDQLPALDCPAVPVGCTSFPLQFSQKKTYCSSFPIAVLSLPPQPKKTPFSEQSNGGRRQRLVARL